MSWKLNLQDIIFPRLPKKASISEYTIFLLYFLAILPRKEIKQIPLEILSLSQL